MAHRHYGESSLNQPALTIQQRIALILGASIVLGVFMRWTDILVTAHPQSATTLYAAQRLLAGELPYADVWYNMMPGALLCNVLALAAGGSLHSVLIFELFFVASGCGLIYAALREAGAGSEQALTAGAWVAAGTVALSYAGGANGAAEWALPAVGAFLYFCARSENRQERISAALAGAAAGAAVLFSPREAILVAAGLVLLSNRRALFAAGFAAVIAVFAGFLAAAGIAGSFFVSFVQYTIESFRATGFPAIAARSGMTGLYIGIAYFAPLGVYLLRGVSGSSGEREETRGALRRLAAAAMIWCCAEAAITVFAGAASPSSLIFALVPAAVLWTAAGGGATVQGMKTQGIRGTVLTVLFFAGFLAFSAFCAGAPAPHARSVTDDYNPHRARLLTKLVDIRVDSDERLLVWSKTPLTYFLSERAAATAYPSIVPLFTPGYSQRAVEQFIADIEETKPDVLVLETSLLPEVVGEHLASVPHASVSPHAAPLFDYMTGLVRDGFRVSAVRGGVIFCIRKPPGDTESSE